MVLKMEGNFQNVRALITSKHQGQKGLKERVWQCGHYSRWPEMPCQIAGTHAAQRPCAQAQTTTGKSRTICISDTVYIVSVS